MLLRRCGGISKTRDIYRALHQSGTGDQHH